MNLFRTLSWPSFCLLLLLSPFFSACTPKAVPEQPLIGLLTDYGTKDAYVAQLKGALYAVNARARLVDLSHEVDPYNVLQGAYLLAQASREFPVGTIFVANVAPGSAGRRLPILLQTKAGKFYLGPDNGIFHFVVSREEMAHAWALNKKTFYRSATLPANFPGRDILGPIAGRLALGTQPETLGTPLKSIHSLDLLPPKSAGKMVSGTVIQLDRYGNIITNISREFGKELVEGKAYRVNLGKQVVPAPLVQTYNEVADGRALLHFNSADLLELSVNKGSAARLYRVQEGEAITIQP